MSETIAFAIGAGVAFVLIGSVFVACFQRGSLAESGQVLTISGVVDLLSVTAAVALAAAASEVPGFAAGR